MHSYRLTRTCIRTYFMRCSTIDGRIKVLLGVLRCPLQRDPIRCCRHRRVLSCTAAATSRYTGFVHCCYVIPSSTRHNEPSVNTNQASEVPEAATVLNRVFAPVVTDCSPGRQQLHKDACIRELDRDSGQEATVSVARFCDLYMGTKAEPAL